MKSFVGDVAEVHPERAQLAVEVSALHADALGELSDLAIAEQQLLLQVCALELLARLALVLGVQQVIRNGLALLGVSAPESM